MLPIAWWVLMAGGFALWGAFIIISTARVAAAPSSPLNGPFAVHASKLDPPIMAELDKLTPYIRTVVRSRGVPRSAEWDVVQAVLIGAWQAITNGRYTPNPRASLRAWVAEIARHQAANYRRWARLRRADEIDPDEMYSERQRDQPDDMLEDAEDRQFVAEQLESPDKKLSILIAHDLEGLPMADIARERRVPLSTAYRWHAAALESLQIAARRRGQPS